jgi:hypothetical protein
MAGMDELDERAERDRREAVEAAAGPDAAVTVSTDCSRL